MALGRDDVVNDLVLVLDFAFQRSVVRSTLIRHCRARALLSSRVRHFLLELADVSGALSLLLATSEASAA